MEKNQEIYLDNAATTKSYDEVNAVMLEMLEHCYGNPSSMHRLGMQAENRMRSAAKAVSDALGVREDEIVFTSGGTESDNLAICGYAMANKRRGQHVITTSLEHPAVAECFRYLAEEGFHVDVLQADEWGNIDLQELSDLLRPDTILVSMMHVNNEVGSILPVGDVKRCMQRAPFAALHVDAVQSFGKIPVLPAKWGVDLLSVSGHKLHGPKGVGALYIKRKTRIRPIVYGGHQQRNLRSGTENTVAICGFGKAVSLAMERLEKNGHHVKQLKQMLLDGILAHIDGAVCHSGPDSTDYILNVSFPGIRSEILLHMLESEGIYVSSGSACASNKPAPSPVLTAMGKSPALIDSAIRFSFSEFNTEAEIERVIPILAQKVADIRKYVRR